MQKRKKGLKPKDKLFGDVPATKLNTYFKEVSGKDFTVKDFRTFHGTNIAMKELQKFIGKVKTKKQKKDAVSSVLKIVSDFLKNTPVVARDSYIDPMVWQAIGGI